MFKKKIKLYVGVIIVIVLCIGFFTAVWGKSYFQVQNIDQIIFHIKAPVEGTNPDVLTNWFYSCLVPGFIVALLFLSILWISVESKVGWLSKLQNHLGLFILSLLILVLVVSSIKYELPNYVLSQVQRSEIFEEHYINPRNEEFVFPEEKRNLIYIFVESMEVTYSTKEDLFASPQSDKEEISMPGSGFNEVNYIPKLSQLAVDNVNFSDNEGLGGAFQATNTGWTVAGMVAQTAGIPLSIPIEGNSYKGDRDFLPGAYSIGEVLRDNGYHQELMVGSEIIFGGRDLYFTQHGQYDLFDLGTARDRGYIPNDYFNFWGYEDSKLFEYAKIELEELSKQDMPFNLTLLTVDTHHADGYVDESCDLVSDIDYMNSVSCSDGIIFDFIEWVQEQPWYENTSVVLAGDHLSMNTSYINEVQKEEYDRHTLNMFINSGLTPSKEKNRDFSVMDMYPTTLATLGATWSGERLGLGTNLFSDEPTLPELIGRDEFNKELSKKSNFYNEHILFVKGDEEE